MWRKEESDCGGGCALSDGPLRWHGACDGRAKRKVIVVVPVAATLATVSVASDGTLIGGVGCEDNEENVRVRVFYFVFIF